MKATLQTEREMKVREMMDKDFCVIATALGISRADAIGLYYGQHEQDSSRGAHHGRE